MYFRTINIILLIFHSGSVSLLSHEWGVYERPNLGIQEISETALGVGAVARQNREYWSYKGCRREMGVFMRPVLGLQESAVQTSSSQQHFGEIMQP